MSQEKIQQAIEVLKPLAQEESTLSAIQVLEDLLKNPDSIQDLVFSISGSGKRGRPATITDAQVIEIGKRIKEAGKRVTGYSIRAALGGKGRTDRYNAIWTEYESKTPKVSGDPKESAAKQSAALKEIGRLIATQDNRITDCPIFAVQQVKRTYGLEADYAGDQIAWISDDECIEASAEEAADLESKYKESYEVPKGWSRTHYSDTYEFVTACFTEQGCKDYIQVNGHNLNKPRIYAYSSFRNEEWKIVRDALLAQTLVGSERQA